MYTAVVFSRAVTPRCQRQPRLPPATTVYEPTWVPAVNGFDTLEDREESSSEEELDELEDETDEARS